MKKSKNTTMTAENRSTMANESYSISSGGAVKRIRTPHPHDVLSGRGGGINSHEGNKIFREWVRERKEAYNLAGSKAEKARVANEVIDLVKAQNPPGRFLQRDVGTVSGPTWWTEVDLTRAIAKTSQALREGAPQIRAAHKTETTSRPKTAKKVKRKRVTRNEKPKLPPTILSPVKKSGSFPSVNINLGTKTPAVTTTGQPIITPSPIKTSTRSPSTDLALESLKQNVLEAKAQVDQQSPQTALMAPPLMSNKEFEEKFLRPAKRMRVEHHAGDETKSHFAPDETPPLVSMSHPILSEVTPLRLGKPLANTNSFGPLSGQGLPRTHSLALSEISGGDFFDAEEEFVNPFADESEFLLNMTNDIPRQTHQHQTPLLRNISSDDTGNGATENENTDNLFGRSKPNSRGSSSRSITELSDISNHNAQSGFHETDFGEGMKLVYDTIHPGISSPEKEDGIPTLLMPWKGGSILRRSSSLSPRGPRRVRRGSQ